MTAVSEKDYVLLTAARNEEEFIEGTLQSVTAQSRRPRRWVIVSDGSTDDTDRIIQAYEKQHDFIIFARRDNRSRGVDFARKVQALRQGEGMLEGLSFDFIGNLDADITFEADYFENLLKEFRKRPKLGIAGGMISEPVNGRFMPRNLSEAQYVPGAVQLFRRACFEQIGGYALSRWGGEDTIAVVTARMKGWETQSIPGLHAYHHKVADESRGQWNERFREGVMFHALGSHPLFELLKSIRWMAKAPYILQGAVRMCGYIWAACSGQKRPVSEEFIRYLRSEQRGRLKGTVGNKI